MSNEKELVFLKILADGLKGVLPITFLLKYQRLKDFGGGTSKGILNAMIDANHTYSSNYSLTKQLTFAVADGASVNFGCHTGAFTKLSKLVGWELPTLQCMNHRLELAMKDCYTGDHTFVKIKEMLDFLFRLFKNSGRLWYIYKQVVEALDLVPGCFTRVGGTRFQPHTLLALSSFLRNFLVTMLFTKNVEHQESGKDSLMTKEMYPKIFGFKTKWHQLKFLASANIFLRVLNETSHLLYLMEADTVMVYQV